MQMPAALRWLNNPVFNREARVRMRGWKAPGLITLYVGILGAISVFFLYVLVELEGRTFSPQLGGIMYTFLAFTQGALLVFSAPGLTAAAIAGERERQTLDLLLVTRMSPMQIVLGKLGAAVGFTILLMFASLPVYGVLFMFGGVSLYRLFLTAIVYLVTVLLLGSIGLFYSTLFKRTQAAVIAAYGTAFGVIIATFFLGVLSQEVFFRRPGFDFTPPAWTLIFAYLNPAMALGAAAGGPAGEITELFRRLLTTPEAQEAIWWKYCLLSMGIVALLLWLAARRIRPLREKE